MKVLHLSSNDISGGAAIAAYRLHQGLRSVNVDSQMFVQNKATQDPSVVKFAPSTKLGQKVQRHFRALWMTLGSKRHIQMRPPGLELFSDDRSVYKRDIRDQLPNCDVINLHWVAGFIDYTNFFSKTSGTIPMVWTLHDMNPFTGGCHYSSGCLRYLDRCGMCPQLGSSQTNDLSSKIWQRKCNAYQWIPDERLQIVAPSRWLAKQAQQSSLLSRFPVSVIPYGIDTTVFSPRDRTVARQALEIPISAHVVLTGAQSLKNRRKGFTLLSDALGEIAHHQDIWLLSFGKDESPVGTNIPHVHVGSVGSSRLLALVYSAADLFVIPSLEDNLPNTVMESLACGTPVVGFDVGGIPDMVRPGETGLLVPVGNVRKLGDAIRQLLLDPAKRNELSVNCRRIAVDEYSLERQARRYIELYTQLLDR